MGLIVGERDPKMNTDYEGAFMVAEPLSENDPYPTRDASDGRFCIVGHDLQDIAEVSYQHMTGYAKHTAGTKL